MNERELFQIGEVARLFHISVGTLRHYEKLGLLRPEYVDPDSGYRYYSTSQFEHLNTIRYLRALDMPLDRIAAFLQDRDVDRIRLLLREQKALVERRRRELELIERKLSNRLGQLEEAMSAELDRIQIEDKPARTIAFLKKQVEPQSHLDLEHSIRELDREEERAAVFPGKVGVGLSASALEKHRFRPYELVFLLLDAEDRFRGQTLCLPAETCAVVRFRGGHDRAPAYYEKLMCFLKERRCRPTGFSKEITIIDYSLTDDTSKFVTEIQLPFAAEE